MKICGNCKWWKEKVNNGTLDSRIGYCGFPMPYPVQCRICRAWSHNSDVADKCDCFEAKEPKLELGDIVEFSTSEDFRAGYIVNIEEQKSGKIVYGVYDPEEEEVVKIEDGFLAQSELERTEGATSVFEVEFKNNSLDKTRIRAGAKRMGLTCTEMGGTWIRDTDKSFLRQPFFMLFRNKDGELIAQLQEGGLVKFFKRKIEIADRVVRFDMSMKTFEFQDEY